MGVIRRLSRFLYTVTHLFTDLIMADFLNKKYKLTSSENFDEYMTELKIGFMTRKLGNSSTPVVEVTLNGDEYTLTTSSLLKTTTIKLEGNKMTHVMKGEPETTIIREFNGNEMKAVLTVNSLSVPASTNPSEKILSYPTSISPFRSPQQQQKHKERTGLLWIILIYNPGFHDLLQ